MSQTFSDDARKRLRRTLLLDVSERPAKDRIAELSDATLQRGWWLISADAPPPEDRRELETRLLRALGVTEGGPPAREPAPPPPPRDAGRPAAADRSAGAPAPAEPAVLRDSAHVESRPGRRPAGEVEAPRRARRPTRAAPVLPWGHGEDRVGALAVDAERLYVYWEVTDESLARAAGTLQAPDAQPCLRIHDVTGRIFDGTNAHHFFEHPFRREQRQWFFDIRRPGSEVIVEMGLRAASGDFAGIARSARVELPRLAPARSGPPRWLTVRSEPGGGLRLDEPAAAAGPAPAPAAPADEDGDARGERGAPHAGEPARWTQVEPGERWTEEVERFERVEPATSWSVDAPGWTTWRWESGGAGEDLPAPGSVVETWRGDVRVIERDGATRVFHAPWQVVIRAVGATGRGEVIGRWSVVRSWVAGGGGEAAGALDPARRPVGSSDLVRAGASERRWIAGSELRWSGASERLIAGASERPFAGASERALRGSRERRLGGASERRLGGSEVRLGGASERLGK